MMNNYWDLKKEIEQLSDKEIRTLENKVDKLISAWKIQNLRAIFYRFHDDQHVGDKRKELYADQHPGVDMEKINQSRMQLLVDNLEGNTLIHPILTPIIEIDDGNSKARGVFTSFGYEALSIHREKPMAIWSMGAIPGVHVKQDGEWRVLSGVWQRLVKANQKMDWVHDMQKSNCIPPLSDEEDRNFLGKYAYNKDSIRMPVPAYPEKDTFIHYPDEMDDTWIRRNLEDREETKRKLFDEEK